MEPQLALSLVAMVIGAVWIVWILAKKSAPSHEDKVLENNKKSKSK